MTTDVPVPVVEPPAVPARPAVPLRGREAPLVAAARLRSGLARRREALQFGLAQPLLSGARRARALQFEALGATPGAVVFLGDSITEQGLWSEWFPEVRTSNRGIGGETTEQVLARLGTAVREPAAVFLLAGTNDLAGGARPAGVAGRLGQVVDGVLDRAPGVPLFVQGVMPRGALFADDVLEVNRLLRRLVDARSADRPSLRYVDLWPALAATDRSLRAEFTEDALHLNGAGYAAWVEVLRPLVDALPTPADGG